MDFKPPSACGCPPHGWQVQSRCAGRRLDPQMRRPLGTVGPHSTRVDAAFVDAFTALNLRRFGQQQQARRSSAAG